MNSIQIKKYLHIVKSFLEKKYLNELVSIVLFGSMLDIDKNRSSHTDIDLLVIVKDDCPITTFNQIKQNLFALEATYLSRFCKKEFWVIKGLQFATGMFVNSFVCRYSDFRERKFKVFSINRIMSKLAPQNSVWWSIQKRHQIIWGENVFRSWKTFPLMTKSDLLRSLLMNWLLATGALFIYPIYAQSAKFSMEAIKWSLFTWRNYWQLSLFAPNQIIGKYCKNASILELQVLSCFIEYRKRGKSNNYFPILALIFVLVIHYSLLHPKFNKSRT
ncbi:MAG: hypothetical protein ACFFDT_07370 [Candidatus Hodarchaeota archaeon]